MKKIGIILDSFNPSIYLHETLDDISKNENIELFFLVNKNQDLTFFKRLRLFLKGKSFLRSIELIFFRLIVMIEFKVLVFFNPNLKRLRQKKDISHFVNENIITLNPKFSPSGLIVKYPENDINKIKSLNLDMIIRGDARGIFRGDILNCTKKGMISFHHGDNRWNRGGPAGFWEVFHKKDSTGFIIQFLSSKLDGGSVIFRGNISTKQSYSENQFNLYNASNPFMSKIINEYSRNDYLPEVEKKIDFDLPILKSPNFVNCIIYLYRTIKYLTKEIIKKLIKKTKIQYYNRNEWGIAFTKKSFKLNLKEGVKISNPTKRYFADPFIHTLKGRSICFFEDYNQALQKGSISALEIFKDKSTKFLGEVIREKYHMSFPFVFEYKNRLYMTPEIAESNAVRLYECINYPLDWKFSKEIFVNHKAVDPMIFKYGEYWWLFFNKIVGDDPSSCLVAYYSDNPLSTNWKPHKLNPIVFDNSIGRNGGIIIENEDIIRIRQKQIYGFYGKGFSRAKITELTPEKFKEEIIDEIEADFFDNISGTHHLNSDDHYYVYDYYFKKKIY